MNITKQFTRFLLIYVLLGLFVAGCKGVSEYIGTTGKTVAPPTATAEVVPTQNSVETIVLTPSATPVLVTPVTATPIQTGTPLPTATPVPTVTPTPSIGGETVGDPYAPHLGNTGYDVLHYDIAMVFNPPYAKIEGSVRIDAVSQVHNLAGFSLDFIGYEISSLNVDDIPAVYTREDGKLEITPAQALAKDQNFSISIAYAGSPVMEQSEYIPFAHHLGLQFVGRSVFTLSEPDGARYWFPCNDHPSDKATYSFAVGAPNGLDGIANGVLVGENVGETYTEYLWEHNYPMSTYLALMAVGDYERIETVSPGGIPIRHYAYKDVQPVFNQVTAVTGEALDWMSELFGPYPFDEFGFVVSRQIRMSLETQGMVVLSEYMLNTETVVHEIVHMWFGDWVSMESWADMWHNEGFAVYLSILFEYRDDPAGMENYMIYLADKVAEEGTDDPLGDLPHQRMFGFMSYQKGAVMVHALRKEVGDEAFFQGLRDYFALYGGDTATREEFINVMEAASGMQLDAFFEEWLN